MLRGDFPELVPQETVDSHFDLFKQEYPTEVHRYMQAYMLAGDGDNIPFKSTHMGRNLLAAHFGANDEELHALCYDIHQLSSSVETSAGQPVLVLRQNLTEEILDPEDPLYSTVEFWYGTLKSASLGYDFGGRTETAEFPIRMGLAPPYLGFGTRLAVREGVHVKLEPMTGKSKIEALNPDEAPVYTYLGTVPLAPSVPNFRRQQKIENRATFIGDVRCTKILEAIRLKTHGDKSKRVLADLALQAAA